MSLEALPWEQRHLSVGKWMLSEDILVQCQIPEQSHTAQKQSEYTEQVFVQIVIQ